MPAAVVPRPGQGGLSMLTLAATDGARADVYLHGAHVTSWLPAGETADRLFVSDRAVFTDDAAIRGGVPVCFPQFADIGPLPMHGFARATSWELVRAGAIAGGAAQAQLRLAASDATRALWPHAFALDYAVTVHGRTLTMALAVHNPGPAAFAFTAALHSYLAVGDLRAVRVRGLAGARYRDKVLGVDDAVETAAELAIDRAIDRVYRAAPSDLTLVEPGRALAIRASGFFDTVVWNPDGPRSATIADMEAGGFLRFVCVEAACAHAPASVDAGTTWHGSQELTAR
jgi:glucose-6-phosphate 1-epimerase